MIMHGLGALCSSIRYLELLTAFQRVLDKVQGFVQITRLRIGLMLKPSLLTRATAHQVTNASEPIVSILLKPLPILLDLPKTITLGDCNPNCRNDIVILLTI